MISWQYMHSIRFYQSRSIIIGSVQLAGPIVKNVKLKKKKKKKKKNGK